MHGIYAVKSNNMTIHDFKYYGIATENGSQTPSSKILVLISCFSTHAVVFPHTPCDLCPYDLAIRGEMQLTFICPQHFHYAAGPSGRAVCGRSPAEIVGSNPIGGMGVYCDCCQVEVSATSQSVVVGDLETS
jgi:hypothetical protein